MKRRVFLIAGLGAAAVGLAGCLSSGGPSTARPTPDPLPADPTVRWLRRYGSASFGVINSTTDGGFLAAGRYRETGADGIVVRTDRAGEERWRQVIDGSGAVGAVETADGGVFVVLGAPDPRLLRLDADGETVWTRAFESPPGTEFEPTDMAVDPGGGYVIAGVHVERVEAGHPSASDERRSSVAVSVDAEGHERWRRVFPARDVVVSVDKDGVVERGPGSDEVSAIVSTGDGYLLVSGPTEEAPSVRGLDAAGTERWRRSYGRAYEEHLYAILPTAREFVLLGREVDPGTGREVPWLLAVDTAGDVLWSRGYLFRNGRNDASADLAAIVADADGGFLVAGTYHPENYWSDQSRPMLAKISGDGSRVEWARQYGDVSGGVGTAVAQARDGAVVLAGELGEAVIVDAGRPTESNLGPVRSVPGVR